MGVFSLPVGSWFLFSSLSSRDFSLENSTAYQVFFQNSFSFILHLTFAGRNNKVFNFVVSSLACVVEFLYVSAQSQCLIQLMKGGRTIVMAVCCSFSFFLPLGVSHDRIYMEEGKYSRTFQYSFNILNHFHISQLLRCMQITQGIKESVQISPVQITSKVGPDTKWRKNESLINHSKLKKKDELFLCIFRHILQYGLCSCRSKLFYQKNKCLIVTGFSNNFIGISFTYHSLT